MSPATAPDPTLEGDLSRLRPSLVGYCYRMLGSGHEAEDATQETMVRGTLDPVVDHPAGDRGHRR